MYSNLIGKCKHTLLKRGKKWSSRKVWELPLGNKLKVEKISDVQRLLSKLSVGSDHPVMHFYGNNSVSKMLITAQSQINILFLHNVFLVSLRSGNM